MKSRKLLAILLLGATAATPAAFAAPAKESGILAEIASRITQFLFTGSCIDPNGGEENGSCIDPNGLNAGDDGRGIDPNGFGAAPKPEGSGLDPHGGSALGDANDSRGAWDPNGFAADKGLGVDPNGSGITIDPDGFGHGGRPDGIGIDPHGGRPESGPAQRPRTVPAKVIR